MLDRCPGERRRRHRVGDRVGRRHRRRRVGPGTGELPFLRPCAQVRRGGGIARPDAPEIRRVVQRDGLRVGRPLHDDVDVDVVGPVGVRADLQLIGRGTGDGIPGEQDVLDGGAIGGGRQVGAAPGPGDVVGPGRRPGGCSARRRQCLHVPVEGLPDRLGLGEGVGRVDRGRGGGADEVRRVVDLDPVAGGSRHRVPLEQGRLGRERQRGAVRRTRLVGLGDRCARGTRDEQGQREGE